MKNKIVSLIIIGFLLITITISTGAYKTNYSNSSVIDPINITYEFSSPNISSNRINGISFDTISIKGIENIGNIGEPNLPMKSAHVLLPPQTDVDEICVTASSQMLEGPYTIELVQQVSESNPITAINLKKMVYPDKIYEKCGIYTFRGYRILFLNLYPIQYNSQTGKIIYHSNIEVTISLKQYNQETNLFRHLQKDESTLKMMIDNPQMATEYQTQDVQSINQVDGQLLIITRDDLQQGFEPLATFHNDRGMQTIMTNLNEINAQTPQDIKEYITSVYQSTGIEYVLIGSDVPGIPVQYVEAYNPALKRYEKIPSDQWYGNLDDDLVSELAIGRACTDTLEEVDHFVSKTIQYISDDAIESYDQCLMVGQKLLALTFGGSYMDELINACDNNDYSTQGIPEIRYHIDKLYEKHQEWNQTELVDDINQNNYHFINHLGHGHFYHIMKLNEPYMASNQGELIPSDDVTNLLNNTKPFFLYSQACYSGSFDNKDDKNNTYEKDCIGEYLTIKTDHAAFAAIMNSRYGLGTFLLTLGPTQFFHREFWDSVFEDSIVEIGKANLVSKIKNINRIATYPELALDYCYWEINLLGDPTVALKIPSIKYPYQPSPATFSGINKTGQELIFSTVSFDPNGDDLYYYFDWGNGENSGWLGPFISNETVSQPYIWDEQGNYRVKVKVKNTNDYESQWSNPTVVNVPKTKHLISDWLYSFLNQFHFYPFLHQLFFRFF